MENLEGQHYDFTLKMLKDHFFFSLVEVKYKLQNGVFIVKYLLGKKGCHPYLDVRDFVVIQLDIIIHTHIIYTLTLSHALRACDEAFFLVKKKKTLCFYFIYI